MMKKSGNKINSICQKCGEELNEKAVCPKCVEINQEESLLGKLKTIYKDTKDTVTDKTSEFIEHHQVLSEKAKEISEQFQSTYEKTGMKDAIEKTRSTSSKKLDVITGQAMYELVKERLALQDRYNDILANKLHEALKKIVELERKIEKLVSSD